MPALFALGLHQALVAVQAGLLPSERLFAFPDDFYVVCSSDRVADVYASLQAEIWRHARIQVHQGKTQLWNRDGVMPHGTAALTAAARIEDEDAIVWRGDPALPPQEQDVKLFNTPLAMLLQGQLARLSTSHDVLLERFQTVPDLHVAWLLLVFSITRQLVVHPCSVGGH